MAIPLIKLLNNQFLRFLVCLVSGTNVMLFLYAHDFVCAGIFIVTAIVASFYSKYMVVILVIAMVICNIICVSSIHRVEGFKLSVKKMKPKNKKSKPNSNQTTTSNEEDETTPTKTSANTDDEKTPGTMAEKVATILSELQTIKKELSA